jgi:1-acyl-sn-glycerol-3-phosphate acyltransferase
MTERRRPEFDDIRPYFDEEIPAAMQRIVDSNFMALMASYVYPDRPLKEVKEMMLGFRTIRDFQLEVMKSFNEQVIKRSTTVFSYEGIERLDPEKSYLFVSNHRDIVLDSCMMQYILYRNGHETTQITFGANLMSSPLVIDIGKSNKMFRVERGGNMKDFYMSSLHLSEYMRHVITERNESVWIAQRNGRTKDGIDATDQGIIKMFCLSCQEDKIKALDDLHIVPVSVSYEWESCDILKALELYESRNAKYIKKPGEDLNSILTGIVQQKGRVNITFCEPITRDELLQFNSCTNNEYHKRVAALLDERIVKAYRLTPNNYIAHDLRYGQRTYADYYTPAEKEAFLLYMEKLNDFEISEPDVLKDIFLGIYANPVERVKELRSVSGE